MSCGTLTVDESIVNAGVASQVGAFSGPRSPGLSGNGEYVRCYSLNCWPSGSDSDGCVVETVTWMTMGMLRPRSKMRRRRSVSGRKTMQIPGSRSALLRRVSDR